MLLRFGQLRRPQCGQVHELKSLTLSPDSHRFGR
jgi:hypothetical protein